MCDRKCYEGNKAGSVEKLLRLVMEIRKYFREGAPCEQGPQG